MNVVDIAFVGTSLTYDRARWQECLEGRLRERKASTIIARDYGQPGATSISIATMFLQAVRCRPRIVVLELGMNDATTTNGISVSSFKANLGGLVDQARANDGTAIVALMTMNPAIGAAAADRPSLAAYYQGVREVAAGRSALLIDTEPAWAGANTAMIPDGIHPTASAAQAFAVPTIASCLRALVV